MAWFDIPEGYSCVVRQNDTTLYGYTGSRRDTFIINGLNWERTLTSTNTSIPANTVCVTNSQIPSNVVAPMIMVGGAIALCFFGLLYKIMKRSFL